MPFYALRNKETGERFEIKMSIHDYDQYRKDNPHVETDWEELCKAPPAAIGMIGEWTDQINKKHPSWNDHIERIGKNVAGSKLTRY